MKMASSEAVLRLRSGFKVVSNSPWVGSLEGQVWLILVINWEKKTISLFHWDKNIVYFAQRLPQQIFLSLNLKTPFGSSEGQISRLQMHNKWSSNSHRPWVHTHFSKAWFFMKMASSEAALRLRSGFKVVSNSPWVGSLEGQVWLILVINWEKKTISLFHWAKNIVSICNVRSAKNQNWIYGQKMIFCPSV